MNEASLSSKRRSERRRRRRGRGATLDNRLRSRDDPGRPRIRLITALIIGVRSFVVYLRMRCLPLPLLAFSTSENVRPSAKAS